MKYYVYILKSEERGGYYIGQTKEPPEERLEKHNSGYYGDKKYTYRDRPWNLFHITDVTHRSIKAKLFLL